jgi:two-component system, cell cycle response regulator
MPGLDGFQVLDSLEAIETKGYLPVLVLTAHPANKLRALQRGARDFISKPLDMVEELMRVRNMMEVRLLHEAARNYGRMLESQAQKDSFTGLANRRLLAERMSMAHARREKRAMGVLFLDLDGFKRVNDTLGHGVGDLLLGSVAGRLQAMAREEDTVARLGGDEFIVLLSEIRDAGSAATVALKVIEAVSSPSDGVEGHSIDMITSVGVSIFPAHGDDSDTLIKRADSALYAAKRAGKHTYRIAGRTDDEADACGWPKPAGASAWRQGYVGGTGRGDDDDKRI